MGFDPLQIADNSAKLAWYREAEVNGVYWGAVVALAVYWEAKGLDKQYGKKDEYLPGMLGFDPLGADSPSMRNAEITNGRVAMIAITTYALEEALTKSPI